ncbi:MAG: hypothetical protein KatS3mg109_0126 [Pirellulaceae bacterium]|nr:MAG: hypothetical protein KatS3mg109_0126 [Pirellulaceae bacterium]
MAEITAITARWPLPVRSEKLSTAPTEAFSVKKGHLTDVTRFVKRTAPLFQQLPETPAKLRVPYGIRIQP